VGGLPPLQPVELRPGGRGGGLGTLSPPLAPLGDAGPYERGGGTVERGQGLWPLGLPKCPVALQGEVPPGPSGALLLLLGRVGRDGGGAGVRLRIGQVPRGQREDCVPRLRQPAVLHQNGDPQITLVDQPVDGARREPGDRAGLERSDLVPGSGQRLHGPASAGDDVSL
jgi:hypothetical protein